jgi:hypothetical protein
MKDVLWDDRLGSGFALNGPRTLLLTFSGQCTYDRLVDVCYYLGRHWRSGGETLVIDFDARKWVDREGIRLLMSRLEDMALQFNGRIYFIHAPAELKRILYRIGDDSPFRLGSSLEGVLKKVSSDGFDIPARLYKHGPPDPDKKRSSSSNEEHDDFRPSRRIQLRELSPRGSADPQTGGMNLLDVLP